MSTTNTETVRLAGAQGFYGDSPRAAMAIARAGAADFLVHDALAELTLSILHKDRDRDPELGYARDIELLARTLYPIALKKGIRVVSNAGGLNPQGAARALGRALDAQGFGDVNIAVVTGDDLLDRIPMLQAGGEALANMDSGQPLSEAGIELTHANAYVGAAPIAQALTDGADIVLTGRVADPCLFLGVLVHHFGWKLDGESDLDRLAAGIAVGHVLECGGQASGGNSYAMWPPDYRLSDLGYPIAEVSADGSAVFTRLTSEGGRVTRDSIREQLVYEIHDPAAYISPDVTVDLTAIDLIQQGPDRVRLSGVKGKPRPERLKLAAGYRSGFASDQFFFFSWPYAYDKAVAFLRAVGEIWDGLPVETSDRLLSIIGQDALHGSTAPPVDPVALNALNEIGVRVALRHSDPKSGRMAFGSIVCLGLNGPPGLNGMPGWGKLNRGLLGLWPTLVPRSAIDLKVTLERASKW